MSVGPRECLSLLKESVVSSLWVKDIWASWSAGRVLFENGHRQNAAGYSIPTHQLYETLKWVTTEAELFMSFTEAELFTLAGALVVLRNQWSEGTSQNASILDFSNLIKKMLITSISIPEHYSDSILCLIVTTFNLVMPQYYNSGW